MNDEKMKELDAIVQNTKLVWDSSKQGPYVDPKRSERKFKKLWIHRHRIDEPALSEEETAFRATLIDDPEKGWVVNEQG